MWLRIYFFSCVVFLFSCSTNEEKKEAKRKLPYYGEPDLDENGDTVYHQVGNFSLTNQEGETFSHNDLKGKVYVADFFFTSCPSICPKMTKNLQRVAKEMKAEEDFKIISFTVDPGNDTVEKLKEYATEHKIEAKQWNLLTGDKETIYELGVYGYLLSAQEDALAPGGFLHSGQFVLVDKEKRIRGVYEGTNPKEMDKLIEDAKILMDE